MCEFFQGVVNRDFLRFFQSLASDANIHPVAGGGDSGASSSSCQVAPLERGAQNVVGEVQVEKKQSGGDVVNFCMESLLQFQNEHLIHKALAAGPSEPVRKRPNYDNRKRKFLAAQKPERRV